MSTASRSRTAPDPRSGGLDAQGVQAWRRRYSEIVIEPLSLNHTQALHAWLTHPHATFWQMTDSSVDDVRHYIEAVMKDPAQHGIIGAVATGPLFYAEAYDPARSELSVWRGLRRHDVGMHVLTAPPVVRIEGTTDAVMSRVLLWCFDAHGAQRVVVEPDERNAAIRCKNVRAGFVECEALRLPNKNAMVCVLTRTDFENSALGRPIVDNGLPARHKQDERRTDRAQMVESVKHLQATGGQDYEQRRDQLMRTREDVHRRLVAKAIREFTHERLLVPVRGSRAGVDEADDGFAAYTLRAASGVTYAFNARMLALEHLVIEPASITRNGVTDLTISQFIIDVADDIGLDDENADDYLCDISATFAAAMATAQRDALAAGELITSSYTTIEDAMRDGHPGFVATNGRIGWSARDYFRYAPEQGVTASPVWVAFRVEHGGLWVSEAGVTMRSLVPAVIWQRWEERSASLGIDATAGVLLPVHPWQFENHVAVTFAEDVAAERLVVLGVDEEKYAPMQSVRTWFNVSREGAPQIKMALAVRNMGFIRGLSPRYMRTTPAVNSYFSELLAGDAVLEECGFGLLKEFASAGYTGDHFHTRGVPSPYTKMLAALWRTNPVSLLSEGERAMTMAALLHRGSDGQSVAGALIAASGLSPLSWMREYLQAYVVPYVHLSAVHGALVMPHGENVVLRVKNGRVVGSWYKDVGEELVIADGAKQVPAEVDRIRVPLSPDDIALSFFTDIMDGYLRHLVEVLVTDDLMSVGEVYRCLRGVLESYGENHSAALARLDLFRRTFAHSCLNRLQLRNATTMVDLADPSGSLLFARDMANPLHRAHVGGE